jgi:hypothetical protein
VKRRRDKRESQRIRDEVDGGFTGLELNRRNTTAWTCVGGDRIGRRCTNNFGSRCESDWTELLGADRIGLELGVYRWWNAGTRQKHKVLGGLAGRSREREQQTLRRRTAVRERERGRGRSREREQP